MKKPGRTDEGIDYVKLFADYSARRGISVARATTLTPPRPRASASAPAQ